MSGLLFGGLVLLIMARTEDNLVELAMKPALKGVARFGLVTLRHRTEAPALPIVRELMQALLHD